MEAFAALLAICERNPPVTVGFPSQRPVARSFDVFLKQLSEQSRRRRFETQSRSLWRQCNENRLELNKNKPREIPNLVHNSWDVTYTRNMRLSQKQVSRTDTSNYLSLPLISASDTSLLVCVWLRACVCVCESNIDGLEKWIVYALRRVLSVFMC